MIFWNQLPLQNRKLMNQRQRLNTSPSLTICPNTWGHHKAQARLLKDHCVLCVGDRQKTLCETALRFYFVRGFLKKTQCWSVHLHCWLQEWAELTIGLPNAARLPHIIPSRVNKILPLKRLYHPLVYIPTDLRALFLHGGDNGKT